MYKKLPITYKVSLILLTIWIVLGLFTFFVHKWIIFPAFSEIEYQEARKNGERVVNAIDREINVLESLCKDWAYWDDTYEYAKSPNPNYLKSNINPGTYETNELNLLYIVGKSGRVIWGKGYHLKEKTFIRIKEFPADNLLNSHPAFIRASNKTPLVEQGVSGIMNTSNGVMIFSSQPILTSDNLGPSQGILIMGRIMTPAWVERLSRQTQLSVEMIDLLTEPPKDGIRNEGFENSVKILNKKKSFYIHELENSFLQIYTPLFDVQDNRILMLNIEVKGKIIERGNKTLTFALNSSIIAVIAILLLMFLVISKSIVNPIATLSDHIHTISKTGDLSSRLNIDNSHDEIGSLGKQYNKMLDQLEKKTEQLNELATTDSLTGLFNRRHALEFLDRGLAVANRYSQDLAIILFDIDHFKKVNDTYGHNVGDEVLVNVSSIFKSDLRSTDIVARIGGEEFLVILPNQNLQKAQLVGEKIRSLVEKINWEQKTLKVTISGGVCADISLASSDMLAAADKKLYSAKNKGRNRIL